MPFPGKRTRLTLPAEDRAHLESIRRSRTEEKRRTIRVAILLDASGGLADHANAAAQQVNRNTVVLCIRKYLRFGLEAALGDLPRSGKPRRVSDEGIAWIQNLACQKPKDLGYAQELWTYRLLTDHIRHEAPAVGYAELARLSRSKLHKILTQGELKPHRVRYYVERRDPEFEQKMAAVLHLFKEVEIIHQGLMKGAIVEPGTVTVSYPLDLYRTILRIHAARQRGFEEVGGSITVLSPLGSKVLAVGALMAALDRNFPVAYVESIDYDVKPETIEVMEPQGEIVHVWLRGGAGAQ